MSSNDNNQSSVTLHGFQGWESMYQTALRYMDEAGTDSVTTYVCIPGAEDPTVMVIIYRGGSYRAFEPLEDVHGNDKQLALPTSPLLTSPTHKQYQLTKYIWELRHTNRLPMSTFNGIVSEFPNIRIDFFQRNAAHNRRLLVS
ncbi:hypothetical protein H9Q72_005362 [Fusarium xylarioides]|uniref:Uncharacterized protein n=1 Tax=Fusarium xylarioides TaxID=221167 RepID=A0A9P7HZS3_9HYPO|nr:hypothetical protein H9Q72_005362 [Fusarium xylarioides]